MNKDLKDYLPYYLGCEVNLVIDGFVFPHPVKLTTTVLNDWVNGNRNYGNSNLLLRPLKSSSFLKYGFAFFDIPSKIEEIKSWTDCINKMRKAEIDCDGLIEAGLALDKTKLQNHE